MEFVSKHIQARAPVYDIEILAFTTHYQKIYNLHQTIMPCIQGYFAIQFEPDAGMLFFFNFFKPAIIFFVWVYFFPKKWLVLFVEATQIQCSVTVRTEFVTRPITVVKQCHKKFWFLWICMCCCYGVISCKNMLLSRFDKKDTIYFSSWFYYFPKVFRFFFFSTICPHACFQCKYQVLPLSLRQADRLGTYIMDSGKIWSTANIPPVLKPGVFFY